MFIIIINLTYLIRSSDATNVLYAERKTSNKKVLRGQDYPGDWDHRFHGQGRARKIHQDDQLQEDICAYTTQARHDAALASPQGNIWVRNF